MLVGTAVCVSAWYFTFSPAHSCSNDLSNLVAGALMYGSYLYLFVDFAVSRYAKATADNARGHVKPTAVKGDKTL